MGDIIIGDKYEFKDHSRKIDINISFPRYDAQKNEPQADQEWEAEEYAEYEEMTDGQMPGKTPAPLSDEQLTRAIENCQSYFWANTAYAVLYCIWRDDYKMPDNMSAFEIKIESLPYSKKRDHCCPEGTLANAFSNNNIYKTRIDTWDRQNPMKRITKLRDELRIQLKL